MQHACRHLISMRLQKMDCNNVYLLCEEMSAFDLQFFAMLREKKSHNLTN